MNILFITGKEFIIINLMTGCYERFSELPALVNIDFIVVFTGPHNYLGMRKALSISKAINIIYPHIVCYGLNFLQVLSLVGPDQYVVFIHNNMLWHINNHKVELTHFDIFKFEPQVSYIGNQPLDMPNYLYYSCDWDNNLENIVAFIINHHQNLPLAKQEYYDKFNIW